MKEHKKNRTVLLICFSVILFMGGLSLAAVPLYELFCKVTGYKGTPNIINVASSESGNRDFIMRYDINISPELNCLSEMKRISAMSSTCILEK